jgi:hypothetical protein
MLEFLIDNLFVSFGGILFQQVVGNIWICSLTQQILSHSFYDWKLCELFLLSGFLICHAVGWYIEMKNQKWVNSFTIFLLSLFYCRQNLCQDNSFVYSEEQVISMLEFLIDSIFVSFGGILFQQVVGIPMGTNCVPLLADLFVYWYESEFLHIFGKFMILKLESSRLS